MYKPEGSLSSPICIIGEAPSTEEMKQGRPFVGPAGMILNECLQYAGIVRSDCYITNVFPFPVSKRKGQSGAIYKGDQLLFSGSRFTTEGKVFVDRIIGELSACKSNVFTLMGAPATAALCPRNRYPITKIRGSILESDVLDDTKCIPTIHPAATLPNRGPYIWRYYIKHDLERVKEQSTFRDIRRLDWGINLEPSWDEIRDFIRRISETKPPLAFDIEISNWQVSRISFAIPGPECITIHFSNQNYTAEEELELWLLFATVLEDPEITKLLQNGMFDISFLADKMNIHVQGPIKDAMVGYGLLYPDFKKDLGNLCSIYTEQPYYKGMVKHGEVDKQDG